MSSKSLHLSQDDLVKSTKTVTYILTLPLPAHVKQVLVLHVKDPPEGTSGVAVVVNTETYFSKPW